MSSGNDHRWLVPHLPDDTDLLAALGRLSIRHGLLDHVLKRSVKTLANLTIEEGDRALAFESSSMLRDLLKKIATRKFGKASTTTLKLRAILANCGRLTEARNRLVHNLWARAMDGEPVLLGLDSSSPLPTVEEVNQLADEIFKAASELNASRFDGGFLFEALKESEGLPLIKDLKKQDAIR